METQSHLRLEGAREAFRKKPNTRTARWYINTLLRYRATDMITDGMLDEGIAEIKQWMKENKI